MTGRDRFLVLMSMLVALGIPVGYASTGTTATISVDGIVTNVHTHRTTVAGVLNEIGVAVEDADILYPPASATLTPGATIDLKRARPITLVIDNRRSETYSVAATSADVLSQAGIHLQPQDLLFVNGQPALPTAPLQGSAVAASSGATLAAYSTSRLDARPPLSPSQRRQAIIERPAAVTITVQRAVPVTISQDGAATTVMSAEKRVGDVLFSQGIYLYSADIVTPTMSAAVSPDMSISIRRARPVTIMADGKTVSTRTQAQTVAEMLVSEGVPPQGKDYTLPDLKSPVTPNMSVQLVRVREDTITESESIAFKTTYQADGNMELDQRATITFGKAGIRKRTIRVVYEDGKEVKRDLDREWIDEAPTTQVIAYGTHVMVRTLSTAQGPVEYWRSFRAWVTYYTPTESGVPKSAPWWGITRTGLRATRGVIAVDPIAIRLHTPMYVPGYGFGAAEDTGSLVLGKTIDLCYDDTDPAAHFIGWETIYLLTPVTSDIPYLLPDYPQERR